MYAHRTIQPLTGLHIEIDLPAEFSDYDEAEVIVLPVVRQKPAMSWEEKVRSFAGILGDDFPDDITDGEERA